VLNIQGLSAGYGGEDVISNISFTIGRGEFLGVLGPNGCGKSTLLKSIARLIGFRGSVMLDGTDISVFPRRQFAKKIALLGQTAHIYFPYTVYETVLLGRYAYGEGFLKTLSAEDKAAVSRAIKKLDIEDITSRMIHELSGGQLQRVFLAKTLAQEPEIILLDEPTNHLDLKHQIELLRLMKDWAKEHKRIVIGALHDLNLARFFADRMLLMHEGKVLAAGTPPEVLTDGNLHRVYDIDVRGFMLESLDKWLG
jgi:iron complex transport system ATP-binding protein